MRFSGERTRPRVPRWAPRPTFFDKPGSFRRGAENGTRAACAPRTLLIALVDFSSSKKRKCHERRDDGCDCRRERGGPRRFQINGWNLRFRWKSIGFGFTKNQEERVNAANGSFGWIIELRVAVTTLL